MSIIQSKIVDLYQKLDQIYRFWLKKSLKTNFQLKSKNFQYKYRESVLKKLNSSFAGQVGRSPE